MKTFITHLGKTKAIFLSIAAALSLSTMALFVKLVSPYASSNFIVFSRYGFGFLYIIFVINLRKHKHSRVFFPKTKHIGLHLLRSFSVVISMLLLFYALKFIPLINANLLFMTNALFVPIFAHLFLHYKTNVKSWFSIAVAFLGVALVLKPGFNTFHIASLIAFASGIMSAITYITVHELVKYDAPHVLMAYSITIAFLFAGVLLIFNWTAPHSLYGLLLLAGVSITGLLYQETFIRAEKYFSARAMTTLLYISIIFSGLLDWLIWKQIPGLLSLIGFLLVIGGNIALLAFSNE
jgi:drug/metabolite transporter (DMT)-like permease